MIRRRFLAASIPIAFAARAADPPGAGAAVSYTSFEGKKVSLFPWRGKRMVFLTKSDAHDPAVMAALCGVFDKVHDFYHEATGRLPEKAKELDGLITVAEVDQTCGAACGYLGATGIELTPGVFVDLYGGWQKDESVDQALPYEFGRNFWFYSPQLAYQKPVSDRSVVTGYAVFMRLMALEAAGAKLGPFRDRSGSEFRAIMESLVDLHEADPKSTWETTLKVDAAPENPLGLNGTDLFASFCLRLARDHGGLKFVRRLWKEVAKLPAAVSTQEAVDHFVIAASAAASADLVPLFTKRWRWPLSSAGQKAAAVAAANASKP